METSTNEVKCKGSLEKLSRDRENEVTLMIKVPADQLEKGIILLPAMQELDITFRWARE